MEIQTQHIHQVNGTEYWLIKWEAVMKRALTLKEFEEIDNYIQEKLIELKAI